MNRIARPETPLWRPSTQMRERSNLAAFMRTLEGRGGPHFDLDAYMDLHRFSVENLAAFWSAVAEHFDLRIGGGAAAALSSESMPGARWFEGAEISYVEHVFRDRPAAEPALLFKSEDTDLGSVSWAELETRVARVRGFLAEHGVGRGDRVAAYLPNGPEAVIAFLASASLGAIWSSCSPDFGPAAALDRLGQVEPKVLFAAWAYQYGGRAHDRGATVAELRASMPSLRALVAVEPPQAALRGTAPAGAVPWSELEARPEQRLELERVPFEHPLWVLYSSGTTGLPKGLVHSHGGILLEHHKWLGLQVDVGPGDRLFWMTTTGWTMWNFLVGGLLLGSAIVLYDGSVGYPSLDALWDLAEETEATCLGAGAGFFASCRRDGVAPRRGRRLSALRSLGSTGSPLLPEDFDWIYEQLGDIWLFSTSGGTDVCTAFVGGTPLMPVRRGEIQAPALGVDVQAWDEDGSRLPPGRVGELVVTRPMPSMPVRLWNDPDGRRYHDAYFDRYANVWRHGDWIEFRRGGGSVIHGRSDSTINRGGVRIGTSEIYRVVTELDAVADAVVVDVPVEAGRSEVMLFVQPAAGAALDDASRDEIAALIRRSCSPRHVPDRIVVVPKVPRTLSGKVVETPLRRILGGEPPATALSVDSLADPTALDWFVDYAASLDHG